MGVFVLGTKAVYLQAQQNTIFEGVYVGTVSLANMSEEEAGEKVEAYVKELMQKPIVVGVNEKTVELTVDELGLTWSNDDLAKQAYGVGRNGNLIHRYKEQQDLKHENIVLSVQFNLDEEQARKCLESHLEKLNQNAIDHGLKRENGEFVFVEGQEGICVDVDESIEIIKNEAAIGFTDTIQPIELASVVEEPRGSKEELAMVKDILGSYHTDYSTSPAGRCVNVQNAAGFINGTLLYPGDTFSVHDTISPITLQNGYQVAHAYENGTVIDSIGGGVCQVSSTLYNAVIRAELEVLKRFPHSMIVSYVEPSQDAAIAGDYKDLEFKNNLEHPVYLEAYTQNKNVYFNVYGVEQRDPNREVIFETEILSETEPTVKFNKTDAPIGTLVKVQSSHKGFKARLMKIIMMNGKVQSKEEFNRSNYAMSPEIYEVGIGSSNKEAVKAVKAAIKTKDLNQVKEAIKYWSDEAIAKREKDKDKDKEKPGDDENEDR